MWEWDCDVGMAQGGAGHLRVGGGVVRCGGMTSVTADGTICR